MVRAARPFDPLPCPASSPPPTRLPASLPPPIARLQLRDCSYSLAEVHSRLLELLEEEGLQQQGGGDGGGSQS